MKHKGANRIMSRYARIWLRSAMVNFSVLGVSRIDFVSYVAAKFVRMGFFFFFVIAIFRTNTVLAGYTRAEVLFFFALMNLVDVVVQLVFFRGLTDLQRLIRTGEFDVVLTKPMNPLFWSAFRIFDFFDLTTVPAAIFFIWYATKELAFSLSPEHIILGIIVFCLGLVVAFAVNLIIGSLAFWTTEVENIRWLYRDMMYQTRFPPEIFPQSVRWFFTYLIPIWVIVAFPTKAFLGRLEVWYTVWAFFAAIVVMAVALWVWRRALRHYTSASA